MVTQESSLVTEVLAALGCRSSGSHNCKYKPQYLWAQQEQQQQPPPKSQKPHVNNNNNIEDIAVVKDRINAIDKEQELVIHLLRGIMTKR